MFRHFLAAVAALAFWSASADAGEKVYRIGLPKSLFRDVPADLAAFAGQPFEELLKDQTDLKGEIVQEKDAMTIAADIDGGKLHFGVLFGHEYAWAREKYPHLQPLFCSVYRPKEIQGVILVRHDCKATSTTDLKGMKVAIAGGLKDHARLFFDAQCPGASGDAVKTATVHEAIQKVLQKEADVAIADSADWSYFQKLYPGPAKNLKELARSEEFPATVMVCKKGAIDEAVLSKLREGFVTAHKNPKAQRLMISIRIERFDSVPDDYDARVKACLKTYPKPLNPD